MNPTIPAHPKGIRAKVLLSSVFGPFARDDEYGSRAVNPMELYQNQVTRVQGAFSLRMFHRSFGLLMLQANMEAPCTVLDFPSQERFIRELQENAYDVVGISAIVPNVDKAARMCRLIRRHQPHAVIVVGGHIANMGGIQERIDADHIVRGDGIAWFHAFLGQKRNEPVKHPMALSAFGSRMMGIPLSEKPSDTAAILIPSVGCPVGCNFCSTSALFGGKGRFVNFFQTGDELFAVMCDIERALGVHSFFILDENFLLHRKRALRLLELMEAKEKSWSLSVFSSARVLRSYSMAQIVGLGISWVWMGIEGQNSRYAKLKDVDTFDLVKELQSHGIRVLGSSIIGLEDHTPENIDAVIDYAVAHRTDFHQFMLYTPNPGTPLYEKLKQEGALLDDKAFPPADAHGQYRFNYRHPHIRHHAEEAYLTEAFDRDFRINGPSLFRLIGSMLNGWQRHKHHAQPRIRQRYARETRPLRTTYAGALWAMRRAYRHDRRLRPQITRLLADLGREFGWKTRISAAVIGLYAYAGLKREQRRLASGLTYEPGCFYEKNAAAAALDQKSSGAPFPEVRQARRSATPA